MEFEKNDGKTERKNFAIYFSNILSQKFLLLRSIKSVFKERLSTIRKLALQVLSNQNYKLSLKKRQYKDALDINYIKNIIKF